MNTLLPNPGSPGKMAVQTECVCLTRVRLCVIRCYLLKIYNARDGTIVTRTIGSRSDFRRERFSIPNITAIGRHAGHAGQHVDASSGIDGRRRRTRYARRTTRKIESKAPPTDGRTDGQMDRPQRAGGRRRVAGFNTFAMFRREDCELGGGDRSRACVGTARPLPG